VLPEDHPNSLFSLGIHKKDYANCALESADLIITVGYNIVEYPPSVWNEKKDKRILHLDFVMCEPDEYYSPELEVIGDVSNSLWAIHSKLEGVRFENHFLEKFRTELHDKLYAQECDECFPVQPARVIYDVREVMDREDIVTLDNGIYKIWFARMYKTLADNTLLLDNALATMGAGLASAMTAKMVFPDRKVLAVLGDGGFMMNSQDIETAVRLKLSLVVLVLRDDAYGFIRWKQQNMGFADFGMQFGNPDFVKYAEAYGASGLRVEKGQSLADVLREAFRKNGPVIVDCPVDYSVNDKLNEDLQQELCHLIPELAEHKHTHGGNP
jgi:acetolactate synthase-1/2/3 large subunit